MKLKSRHFKEHELLTEFVNSNMLDSVAIQAILTFQGKLSDKPYFVLFYWE